MEERQVENGIQKMGGVRIHMLNAVMIFLASLVSLIFLQAVQQTSDAYSELERASDRYITCEAATNSMKDASNYLTAQVRGYAVTQKQEYLDNYFNETLIDQQRGEALEVLEGYLRDEGSYNYLERAVRYSEDLMDVELYAIKLVADATDADLGHGADKLAAVTLRSEDAALSPQGKIDRAISMVYSDEYSSQVELIERNVVLCREELVEEFDAVQAASSETLHGLLFQQQVLTWALLAVVIALILSFIGVILWPVRHYIARIKENEPLPMTGAYELRYLAKEYNTMYEENLRNHDQLRRKAEHDHLTGLYNRSVFEKLLYAYREESIALLLIDADYFKNVNDTLGHDGGDAMLQKISRALTDTFRSTDYPCRIGGDEFAVIMTEMNPELKNVVLARVKAVNEFLEDTSDGLPVMTLSIGVAFSGEGMDAEPLFKNADNALYEVKEAGRNGCRFFEG